MNTTLVTIGSGLGIFLVVLAVRLVIAAQHTTINFKAIPNVPPLPAKMPDWADPAHSARVENYIAQMRSIPWGAAKVEPAASRAQFEAGMNIVLLAEGNFDKMSGAIDAFLTCNKALSWTGAAFVMLRLSYVSGSNYIPQGVREAIGFSSIAVKADPKEADAWFMRIRALSFYPGNAAETLATRALEKARTLAPNHPRLLNAEALYYRKTGELGLRFAVIQREYALRDSPLITAQERLGILDSMAQAFLAADRAPESLPIFDEINQIEPGSAWGWHNASLAYNEVGRYAEALERSERALSVYEFGVARRINALLRLKLGETVPFLDTPRTASERENAVAVRFMYAQWFSIQPDVQMAEVVAQFRLALQLDPDHAATHYALGLYLLDTAKRPDLAAAALADAHRLLPSNNGIFMKYAVAQGLRGEAYATVAEEAFQQLLGKGNYFDAHREYGRFLLTRGPDRRADAEAQIRQALDKRPEDPDSNALMEQIRAIKRAAP